MFLIKLTITNKGIKITLSLALMVFVLTMTPASTFFQITKPVSAAALTSVSATPDSNVINERATYNFLLTTGTTAAIKTIQIAFPSGFNLENIRLIERSGIGSGTLSFSGSTLKYTVSSTTIAAGTPIKLEIGSIIAEKGGTFTVTMSTLNSGEGIIDGPTTSAPFTIKRITGSDIAGSTITGADISPGFMIRKSLLDDQVGNSKGWNPGGVNPISVSDSDISGSPDGIFVSTIVQGRMCSAAEVNVATHAFVVLCNSAPLDQSVLHYMITKLPSNIVTSSLSASSSPFDSTQGSQNSNVFPPSLP